MVMLVTASNLYIAFGNVLFITGAESALSITVGGSMTPDIS